MVGASYSLSLDSIESKEELGSSKYKSVSFIKTNYFDELISYFYGDLPTDTAFHIKYDNDVDSMGNDFASQYDELYQYGARNIVNNKDYTEEFEYFAPLYISPNNLPKNFIIFRVDGPGIGSIKKENIKSSIFSNFKTVKLFDLTKSSALGEWLNTNFNNNSFFPLTPFEMSFENLEFSKWNGIDYKGGGYTSKSMFLENIYEEEKELFELEKIVFDGYKNNSLVFPNILNLSFLFDDTPANTDSLRKWSMNRYYGFYLDEMVQVKTLSPYIAPFIKSDAVILDNNILYSPTGVPFVEGFFDHKVYYVEYLGEYYKVEKYQETGTNILQPVTTVKEGTGKKNIGTVTTQQFTPQIFTKYRIVSDIKLAGKQSLLNKNTGSITNSVIESENKKLINYDNTNFVIDEWDTADLWIIEIDGMYHNLVKSTDGSIKVYSDYSFKFNENDYTYWVNKNDPSYTKKVSFIVDKNNVPKKFKIYKLKFSDIKDFDTRIVDTEYSKYEYEKKYELTETDETKMYFIDLLSNSNPKDYDDFTYKQNVVHIPVASEYTANYETFKIESNDLSQIWRKNPVYCRWGFQNSNSANDMPYLLNNSLLFEDYNRTVNPFDPNPKRIERNLDYFYTINSSTASYLHHTLHIESNKNGSIDNTFRFELDKYLNLGTYSVGTGSATYSFDYFSYLFDRKTSFDSGKVNKNVKKYSLFNSGDKSIPNITLFKGVKFFLYDVEDVKKDETGTIGVMNLRTSNKFDGYKFSILLSDNEWSVTSNGGITVSTNSMSWTIFDDWKMDKTYAINDIVVIDDILYKSTASNIVSNPKKEYTFIKNAKSAPYNQPYWDYYKISKNVFWSPTSSYPGAGVGNDIYKDVVFNHGDYYFSDSLVGGTEDFWNPYKSDTTGYTASETVLFKGKYYMSMTSSNHHRPDYQSPRINTSKTAYNYYWVGTQSSSPKWKTVDLWNPSTYYPTLTSAIFVVHNDVLYKTNAGGSVPYGSETGNEPGISTDWTRVYSLKPDTSIIYTTSINPIIEMNDSYYMINSNSSYSTLENGINVYINKKWKNVLINITITDNTIPNLSEKDRDSLYNDLNKKLTAHNFIQSINDITNKYDYTDYLNYIIIEEDGSIKKYNYNNIEGLPYYMTCESPDEITMKSNSLIYKPVITPKSLKSTKTIVSISNDLSNINNYNKVPIAAEIIENKNDIKPSINYSGAVSITTDIIYRFSGYYMPVFYDIQLFSKNTFTASTGNYIFDINLSEFGLMKERKIRKVNKDGSVLKLRNEKDQKSIYPMLDEFGYTTTDFFIFSSSWEYNYYITTSLNPTKGSAIRPVANPIIFAGVQGNYSNIGIQVNPNQNQSL